MLISQGAMDQSVTPMTVQTSRLATSIAEQDCICTESTLENGTMVCLHGRREGAMSAQTPQSRRLPISGPRFC